MKKLIYLFVAVMILSILAGCQKDAGNTQESISQNPAVSETVVSEDASDVENANDMANTSAAETMSETINTSDTEKVSEEVSTSEDEESETDTDNENSEEEEFAKELAEMQIVEEEGVRDNALFSDFVDGKITALTYGTNESWYCKDFYKEVSVKYHKLYGAQFLSGDVNGDGAKELLMLLYYRPGDGDLYVFHEENGSLKAWEVFEDFMWDRYGGYYLHENGMIEGHSGYGVGHSFYKYTDAGELQTVLWDYYTSSRIEGGDRYDNTLYIYENNVLVRQIDTAYTVEEGSEELVYVVGSKELQDEINSIVQELDESSPVVREIHMARWED